VSPQGTAGRQRRPRGRPELPTERPRHHGAPRRPNRRPTQSRRRPRPTRCLVTARRTHWAASWERKPSTPHAAGLTLAIEGETDRGKTRRGRARSREAEAQGQARRPRGVTGEAVACDRLACDEHATRAQQAETTGHRLTPGQLTRPLVTVSMIGSRGGRAGTGVAAGTSTLRSGTRICASTKPVRREPCSWESWQHPQGSALTQRPRGGGASAHP
jgi:hypothetical protein